MHQMPAQIYLPIFKAARFEQRLQFLIECRLRDVDGREFGNLRRGEIIAPAERRSQRLELLRSQLVKQLVRIALIDARELHLG